MAAVNEAQEMLIAKMRPPARRRRSGVCYKILRKNARASTAALAATLLLRAKDLNQEAARKWQNTCKVARYQQGNWSRRSRESRSRPGEAERGKDQGRLSRNTRQQVVEMERADGEMVLHREEIVCGCGARFRLRRGRAQLKTRLKDARRCQSRAPRGGDRCEAEGYEEAAPAGLTSGVAGE